MVEAEKVVVGLRARRNVDTTVLPLLFLGLLVFQLDRMNLASALTDGFAMQIGLNQNTINLGYQLMFLGIIILELPANMILQRIESRKWISAQVFIFGLVVTFQVFVKNRTGFLVSRMFLGLCEAGYIPGGIYTLSIWYTKPELAKRVAVFLFGMFGGNAISPLLASGILKLGGRGGLKGWQWLFLLEGWFTTMCVSLVLLLLLPGSPAQSQPLLSKGLIRFKAGTQYFRGDDLPFYRTGLRTMIIMVAVGMVSAIIQEVVYWDYNRKARKRWEESRGEQPWLYVP